MEPDAIEILLLAGLVVVGGTLQWYLGRLGRRLRLRVRIGAHVDPRVRARLRRIELALLLSQASLWAGVAWILSERLPGLHMSREAALALVTRSVTAPLFTLNDRGYSALNLVTLPALLGALWIGVSAVVGLLKHQLARFSGGSRGVHESIAILARLVLAFLGSIVIFQAWGLDVSSLTFLASVLGVGLGFGLQNIANNFMSGILIGLERPVQPGDFVHVGEFSGTVKRIGARSTEIETIDRVAILVPNARFLEMEVINWSHGDPVSQVHVPIGVAYRSDVGHVRTALLEAAAQHPKVLSEPRAEVRLVSFGESALDFELLVWTDDPRHQFRLKSELNFLIEAGLRRWHIAVPFPQQDVHVRSPELLEAVRAWTARTFTEEERARARSERPAASPSPPAADTVTDGADAFSDARLDAIVERMREPGGIEIADRRHLLRVHRRCFIGQEAVDWLVRSEGMTRAEAVEVGCLLLDRGLLHHVLDEHGFRDGNFYFRFRADEASDEQRHEVALAASKHASPAAG